MGYSNSSSEKLDYLKLNGKASETESPFFSLQGKVDGTWKAIETFDTIEGYLIGVSRREGEFQGDPIYSVRLKFKDTADSEKQFQVEATYNNLTYSILNSLLNTEPGEPLMIRVYARTSKTNDKVYATSYMEANGERVGWFHEYESLPRPEYIKHGRKTIVDDTELVEFFHKVIDDLALRFGNASTKTAQPESQAEKNPTNKGVREKAKEDEEQRAIERDKQVDEAAKNNSPKGRSRGKQEDFFDGQEDDLPF